MQKTLMEKESTIDFILQSILNDKELIKLKKDTSLVKPLNTLKEYILKNKGLLNFKKDNPYYYTLIISSITKNLKPDIRKEYEPFRQMLLELKIRHGTMDTNRPSQNNKIVLSECSKYGIDFSNSTDPLKELILSKTEFENEATLVIKTIENHIKISKLNNTSKENYKKLISELTIFTQSTKREIVSKCKKDIKKTTTSKNATNKCTLNEKKTTPATTTKKATDKKPKKVSDKTTKTNRAQEDIVDSLIPSQDNIANPIIDKKTGEYILIKDKGISPYRLDNNIVANFVNQQALITGLSNIVRSSLRQPIKEKDNLRKLTFDKNSILYNSIIYDVRLYINNLTKVANTINNYSHDVAHKITEKLNLTGIKSVELQNKLADRPIDYDAISLKLMADSLYLLSATVTLKNCIADSTIENGILTTELKIIQENINNVIVNLNK